MLAEVALDMGTFVFFAVIVPAAMYGSWLLIVRLTDRWWGSHDQ